MNTKKKKIIIFVALYLLCFSAFCLFLMPKSMPRKPFKYISMLNINSIEIVRADLGQKNDGVFLLQEDEEKVISIIRDIKIKGRHDDSDDNYLGMAGGIVYSEMFCIRTREGKTVRIGLSSYTEKIPIIYIDFIEYDLNPRSVQKCEELYNLYDNLLSKY